MEESLLIWRFGSSSGVRLARRLGREGRSRSVLESLRGHVLESRLKLPTVQIGDWKTYRSEQRTKRESLLVWRRFGALSTVLNQVLAPTWKMFTPPYILLLIRTFLTLEGIVLFLYSRARFFLFSSTRARLFLFSKKFNPPERHKGSISKRTLPRPPRWSPSSTFTRSRCPGLSDGRSLPPRARAARPEPNRRSFAGKVWRTRQFESRRTAARATSQKTHSCRERERELFVGRFFVCSQKTRVSFHLFERERRPAGKAALRATLLDDENRVRRRPLSIRGRRRGKTPSSRGLSSVLHSGLSSIWSRPDASLTTTLECKTRLGAFSTTDSCKTHRRPLDAPARARAGGRERAARRRQASRRGRR